MSSTSKAVFAAGCVAAMLAGVPSHATVISGTNSIPVKVDAFADTSTISFATPGTVLDVKVTIDFIKCDGDINSTYDGCTGSGPALANDIYFYLTSPSGTPVDLLQPGQYGVDPSGAGPEPGARIVLVFDDSASSGIDGTTFESGTFTPIGSLTTFAANFEDVLGDWKLHLENVNLGAPLAVVSFTLDITIQDAPEPMTALLLGFGLAGIGFSRRRSH